MRLFTNSAIFLVLVCVLAPSLLGADGSIVQTIALKPGQQYTVRDVPEGVVIHIEARFPVNLYFGNCVEPQTIETDLVCRTSGPTPLTIIDSRNHVFGRFNSVRLTFTRR